MWWQHDSNMQCLAIFTSLRRTGIRFRFTLMSRFHNIVTKSTKSCQRLPIPPYHHVFPQYLHRPCRQVNRAIYHVSFYGNLHIEFQGNTRTLVHGQLWNILQLHKLCDESPNCTSYHTLGIYDHHECEPCV